jgi:hypothetical protein
VRLSKCACHRDQRAALSTTVVGRGCFGFGEQIAVDGVANHGRVTRAQAVCAQVVLRLRSQLKRLWRRVVLKEEAKGTPRRRPCHTSCASVGLTNFAGLSLLACAHEGVQLRLAHEQQQRLVSGRRAGTRTHGTAAREREGSDAPNAPEMYGLAADGRTVARGCARAPRPAQR